MPDPVRLLSLGMHSAEALGHPEGFARNGVWYVLQETEIVLDGRGRPHTAIWRDVPVCRTLGATGEPRTQNGGLPLDDGPRISGKHLGHRLLVRLPYLADRDHLLEVQVTEISPQGNLQVRRGATGEAGSVAWVAPDHYRVVEDLGVVGPAHTSACNETRCTFDCPTRLAEEAAQRARDGQ